MPGALFVNAALSAVTLFGGVDANGAQWEIEFLLPCYVDGDPQTAEKMVQVTFAAETGRFVFSDPLTASVLSTGMGCVRESGAPDRFS